MEPRLHATACNRDCPDACSLIVRTDDRGRAVEIRGDPEHPFTRGFVCYRTGRFLARQYAADRLIRPLVRRRGVQVETSFDEALDEIERALRRVLAEDGPAAVAALQTGGSLGITKGVTDLFFRLLGPVTEFRGDICGGAGTAAQLADFGVCDSHDVEDVRHSRHVLLWGKNVGVANIHLVPLLRECRERGAEILVIDPVPPEAGLPGLARIAPRPGRDVELALGVGRFLLERGGGAPQASHVGLDHVDGYRELCYSRSCEQWAELAGVDPADLERLAHALLSGPTSIHVGWGLQRRVRGGLTVRALDALGAVSGNLGIAGGGVSFYYWRRRAFREELFETGVAPSRTLDVARFGHEVSAAKDPRLRFLWISCANPVASLPDAAANARALEDVEFSVCVDTHPTDTTRRASVVLPAATMLEHGDLLGAYGHHWLQLAQKVVEPPPEVRSDLEIVQELGRRLGLGSALAGDALEWAERLIRDEARAGGVSVAALAGRSLRSPLAASVLFADGRVPTTSGRVCLLTAADYVAPAMEPSDGRYPLWLFSSSHRRAQSSQWVAPEASEGPLPVRIHPDSAEGLADGAPATLHSPLGELAVIVRHDRRMRRDCVLTPKSGALDLGRAANILVPAQPTDLGGGAAYLDVRVRLGGKESESKPPGK